jgi:hypothetical protein
MPGAGYWVKVNGAGTLSLSGGSSKPVPAADPLAAFNMVRLSDGREGGQTLYFGADPGGGFRASAFELPPASPAGGFDARFASGSMVETYPAVLDQAAELLVAVRTRALTVNVRWRIDTQDRNSYTLKAENGRGFTSLSLTQGEGEAAIAASPSGIYRITVSDASMLPSSAMLLQNYPNPFNPTTTIPFALAAPANVTLTVFNVLGEAVATLVDHQERSAGFHQIVFDASRLSSGIYYYQMQAVGKEQPATLFQQVQKLVLLK